MFETILFYLISFFVILFALGVVLSRSAVYSVLSLVAAMGSMAGLFFLLKSYLVATVLILVYAGAILVLFLFVVMLLDSKNRADDWSKFHLSPVAALVLCGLFFTAFYRVITSIKPFLSSGVEGTTAAVGRVLFNESVLPFELTGFLILAAVVSVVVLAKKDA